MHIFSAIIGKLRRDVTDDKALLRDWNFPCIHHNVDSGGGCLEASVRMVYCAAFDCSANSSKNTVTCSWFKFPTEPTLFKKANVKPTKHSQLCSLRENLFRLRSGPEKLQPWLISLKQDDVPTLFPVVEAMLMQSLRRTQAATRAPTTSVHL